jgi:hypothetical protein
LIGGEAKLGVRKLGTVTEPVVLVPILWKESFMCRSRCHRAGRMQSRNLEGRIEW